MWTCGQIIFILFLEKVIWWRVVHTGYPTPAVTRVGLFWIRI